MFAVEAAAAMPVESDLNGVAKRNGETPAGTPDPKPPLKLSQEEAATRQAVKDKIAAKYGLSAWSDAPPEALLEYQNFLKSRMEAQQ